MSSTDTKNTTESNRNGLPLLLIIATAYIAALLNIQGFVAMMPLVQAEFGITRAQAGLYSSFYFLSATIIAIFAGRIVDRIGSKAGMLIGCSSIGAMMVLHGVAPTFTVILGFAFVTGIGFSLITPAVNSAVIRNVAPTKRAGSMGIAHGVGGSGALIGTMVLPALGERVGWRPVMLGAGLLAIAIGVFIHVTFGRFSATTRTTENASDAETTGSFTGSIGALLSRRAFLCACIMGLSFGISIASVTGHFALFMNQDLGYSPALAGIGLGAFHIGGMLGQPTWGVVNDKMYRGRRHAGLFTLAVLTGITALVFGLVVARGGVGFPLIVGLSSLMGFFVLGTPSLYFTTVTEIAPIGSAGIATGVALVFSRIGVVLAPPIFGYIADITGRYATSWIVLAAAVVVIPGIAMLWRSGKAGS
ncbi:MAG: MFS transporter [Spirochaetaceae bacterium]|nr:MAG: MFS transporter [Spirochaetaceae bacterium]